MNIEDLQKYNECMKERTKLKRTVCPVVFEDDWYYQNMRIIIKRYIPGIIVYTVVLCCVEGFLKKNAINTFVYCTITGLISLCIYVYIMFRALIQSSLDMTAMQGCYGYNRIQKTAKRIWRNVISCACLNYIASLCFSYLYYVDLLFSQYAVLVFSFLLFTNSISFLAVYKTRKVIFRFAYGFIEGTTKMCVKLKSGKEFKYSDDFDVSAVGVDLIIVRKVNGFKTYNAEDIAMLVILNNDEDKVVYKYDNMEWVLQNN